MQLDTKQVPPGRVAVFPPSGLIPGLVWIFQIGEDGTSQALPIDQPVRFEPGHRYWMHFNLADARALPWLGSAGLQPLAQSLLLSKDSFQQLHADDRCVYGVISDLLRDFDEASEDTGYLRFALTETFLISARHHPLCAVDMTRCAIEAGQRIAGTTELFEMIVDNVSVSMEKVADRLAKVLDQVEEQVLSDDDNTDDLRQNLGRIRRTCVRLHRQISGLRLALHRFEQGKANNPKPQMPLRAGILAQRLDGLDRAIPEMRDRSRLLQEELLLKIEEQGNDNLRVLSILTALLLPPTLVTGVFGMNLKGLPFAEMESGFWWAALLIVMSSTAAYLVLKRNGIIR
jgi:zinc transporter